jgi:hypothetical protein
MKTRVRRIHIRCYVCFAFAASSRLTIVHHSWRIRQGNVSTIVRETRLLCQSWQICHAIRMITSGTRVMVVARFSEQQRAACHGKQQSCHTAN